LIELDRERKGREQMAREIGITVEELEAKYEAGLVAICPRCESVEVFYKKGKYRQDKCVKCQRKERK
jgi:uncharacterized protein (DUF983 family)